MAYHRKPNIDDRKTSFRILKYKSYCESNEIFNLIEKIIFSRNYWLIISYYKNTSYMYL